MIHIIQNLVAAPAAAIVYIYAYGAIIIAGALVVATLQGWKVDHKNYLRRKADERTMRIGQKGIIVPYKQ